jgi:hypothetical protein
MMQRNETAELIPDWAAWLFTAGVVLAIGGFVAAWLFGSGFATLILATGLIVCALGLRKAERVVAKLTFK